LIEYTKKERAKIITEYIFDGSRYRYFILDDRFKSFIYRSFVIEAACSDILMILPSRIAHNDEKCLKKISLASIRAPRVRNEKLDKSPNSLSGQDQYSAQSAIPYLLQTPTMVSYGTLHFTPSPSNAIPDQ